MVKLFDGSMWAGLKEFGFDAAKHKPHWTFEANQDLDLIKKVYSKNLEIGVDFITTNTYHFGSTLSPEFAGEAEKYEQYFKNACYVLENLVKDTNVKILGSMGTFATYFHDCSEYTGSYADLPEINVECSQYFRNFFNAFKKHSNIREVVIETISTVLEVEEIVKIIKEFPEFKVVISFTLNENGHLRHGENLEDFVESLAKCDQIIGIGVNCTDPKNVLPALKIIESHEFQDIFVYPNIGDECFLNGDDSKLLYNDSLITTWIECKASVIGGCCGVDFESLTILKLLLDEKRHIK